MDRRGRPSRVGEVLHSRERSGPVREPKLTRFLPPVAWLPARRSPSFVAPRTANARDNDRGPSSSPAIVDAKVATIHHPSRRTHSLCVTRDTARCAIACTSHHDGMAAPRRSVAPGGMEKPASCREAIASALRWSADRQVDLASHIGDQGRQTIWASIATARHCSGNRHSNQAPRDRSASAVLVAAAAIAAEGIRCVAGRRASRRANMRTATDPAGGNFTARWTTLSSRGTPSCPYESKTPRG